MTEESNRVKLKGSANYLEWFKRFRAFARIKNWGSLEEGVFVPTSDSKELEGIEWIINNTADEAIGSIDPSK